MQNKTKAGIAIIVLATLLPLAGAQGGGGGGGAPFVQKSGDTMTGNLVMGANSIGFNGGNLSTADGDLQFNGQDVCLEGGPCASSPAAAPLAFHAYTGDYVGFLGDDICTEHSGLMLTVEAPGPGLILITGTVSIEFEHYAGIQDWGRFRVATPSEACAAPGLWDVVFSLNQEHADSYYQQTLPATRALDVFEAGTYTFSVYGMMEQGFSPGTPGFPSDRYLWGNLQGVWYPE